MGEMLVEVVSETAINLLQNHQIVGQNDCMLRKNNFCLNVLRMKMST